MDNKDDELKPINSEDEEIEEVIVEENDGPVLEPSFDVSNDNLEEVLDDAEDVDEDIFDNDSSNVGVSPKTNSSNDGVPNEVTQDTTNPNNDKYLNEKLQDATNKNNKEKEKEAPNKKTNDNLNNKEDKEDKDNKNNKDENREKDPKKGNSNNLVNNKKQDTTQEKLPDEKNAKTNKGSDSLDSKGGLNKKGSSRPLDQKNISRNNDISDKIPGKKADKMRKGLDAAALSGNIPAAGAQKAVKFLDKVMGKERVDWMLEKLGENAVKKTAIKIFLIMIHALIPIILLVLGLYIVFGSMLDTLLSIDAGLRNLANTAEKFKNLINNGNFADSKEAFYDEFERLSVIYGEELDQPLLLASTFYRDLKDGYDTRYDNIGDIISDEISGMSGEDIFATLMSILAGEIDSLAKEAEETYDPTTGLVYTVGKVYRLRGLAGHMFGSDYSGREVTLGQWLELSNARLNATFQETIVKMAARLGVCALEIAVSAGLLAAGVAMVLAGGVILKVLGIITLAIGVLASIFSASNTFRAISDIKKDLDLLLKIGFMGLLSIGTIKFDATDSDYQVFNISNKGDEEHAPEPTDSELEGVANFLLNHVKVMYFTPKYDEARYKKYLKETYIPNNPDFDKYLGYDSEGNPTESSIDRVINEIYSYKDYFTEIFMKKEKKFTEKYSEQCLGAIDKKLAAVLELPTDINTSNCIDFSGNNGYGYQSNGKLHNGIELNAKSTGNKEGDKVYSVLGDGTVKASSFDGTMECVGGCLEIEYTHSIISAETRSEYKFSVIYKGLSKESVTLKTGDTVTKRQELGVIGSADESEDMGIPSLYIEFRNENGIAIDPTNMIVKCNSPGIGNYEGAKIYEIPPSFKQTSFYTVTCYGVDGWHYSYYSENNDRCTSKAGRITPGSPQEKVHDIWIEQGARFYDNKIAIITVDGVDRFLAAIGETHGPGDEQVHEAGDVINAILADGTVVPLVLADVKYHKDPDYNGYGHVQPNGTVNIIEMEVQWETQKDGWHNVKTGWGVNWDTSQPVSKIVNNGSILSGEFDLSLETDGSGEAISSNGLKLCYPVGTSSKVEKYVSEAIKMANNDSIGYSQVNRNLDPDVDCSSFVYYSLVNSGVMSAQDYAFNTSTMGDVLKANGFDEFDYDINILKKGDIIVNPNQGNGGHATIYIGDNKEVAAHSDKDSKPGDSTGEEVNTRNYTDKGLNYEKIYRVKYDKDDLIGINPGTNNPGPGSEVTSYGSLSAITVKINNYTPESYTKMLHNNNIYQSAYKVEKNGKKVNRWADCCRGVAKTHACGMARGVEIKVEDVEDRFDSNCDADPPECKGKFNNYRCFASEAEMTKYVINRINEGKTSIIHVSGVTNKFTIKGSTKEDFYKNAAKYKVSRHFVTAVGYIKGGDPTDSLNLLYIDSASATYKRIGESRFILKTTDDIYGNTDMKCSADTPFSVIDVD